MPWQEVSTMSLRHEFVVLAEAKETTMRALCQRFGISPKTGYKWLARYRATGVNALVDHSRRPQGSPRRTASEIESAVVRLRVQHPAWGARKLRRRLCDLGQQDLPCPSTFHAILQRHDLIDPAESPKHQAWVRFEHEAPNQLWQMDFKGHFALVQGRCHALTVLDDHARFNLCLQACADERGDTVQQRLTDVLRRYGLPERMTMDNGSPWGCSDEAHHYTPLTVWLIRLGIRVSHSRPYHPQTQGKDERFHRTLNVEVLHGPPFRDLAQCQRHFDDWRDIYNLERPHEALGMATPASRYQPSPRGFPETLPPIEYADGDIVRKVQEKGEISYLNRAWRIPKALRGYPVALRYTQTDGLMDVFFCHKKVAQINLQDPK
ncbi:MAG: IS481 family transposase [Gammaproteobacteria bacterium]|nr:IS481 family transposase [Gammaproteobacteria bacterium]MBU2478298.1 IS481 family transposase [Gammaproteobacteria bacterium]